jgi:hypothetical protein
MIGKLAKRFPDGSKQFSSRSGYHIDHAQPSYRHQVFPTRSKTTKVIQCGAISTIVRVARTLFDPPFGIHPQACDPSCTEDFPESVPVVLK